MMHCMEQMLYQVINWKKWDKERAKKVINFVRDFLDERFPLLKTSWKEISKIQIEENKLVLLKGSKKDFLKIMINL